jgi:hypothetical protein
MVKYVIATVAALSVSVSLVCAQAKTPTQADFDACNVDAKTKLGVPAASPGTGGTTTPPTTTPGSPTPSTAPGAGSTTAPQVGAAEAGLLQGIAEAGRKDPAYQKAYATCMKERGF